MFTTIKLLETLVQDAKSASKNAKITISEQIEYWARLGKASDENPDLTIPMLQDILASRVEMKLNKLNRYRFGWLRN